MTIWWILAAFSGTAVVAVSAWARGERRKAEKETEERRDRARMQMEETHLLAKLRDNKES